jgi:pimeloyl-ACP methyl ester carboxylesterase
MLTRTMGETGDLGKAQQRGRTVRLPDGRLIGYAEYGDPRGLPMLGFHGTPGSRLMFRLADEPARELGIRLIAPERPGFGLSSYHRGRTLGSYAQDMADFADKLGLKRFAVAGISGGGPYAAACAALLPDRVSALGLVSPVGPVQGSEGAPRIGPGHHVMFRLSPRVPPILWPVFAIGRAAFLYAPLGVYGLLMSRCAASDWKILARGDVRRNLLEGVAEGVRPGVRSALQEMKLFSRPWNIPFGEIRAPSILWQGTADRNVPPSAAFRLGALIPGCEVHRVERGGHYWIFDNISLVLDAVAAAARRNAAHGQVTGAREGETLH